MYSKYNIPSSRQNKTYFDPLLINLSREYDEGMIEIKTKRGALQYRIFRLHELIKDIRGQNISQFMYIDDHEIYYQTYSINV